MTTKKTKEVKEIREVKKGKIAYGLLIQNPSRHLVIQAIPCKSLEEADLHIKNYAYEGAKSFFVYCYTLGDNEALNVSVKEKKRLFGLLSSKFYEYFFVFNTKTLQANYDAKVYCAYTKHNRK